MEKNPGQDNQCDLQVLYRLLVEQLPVGLFRKDVEGRYVLVNPQFCKLRGKGADELLGKTPAELAVSAARDTQEADLLNNGASHHTDIMRTGQPIEVQECYALPDHSELFLHVVKSPAFDAGGKIVGTQGMMVDNTLFKRAEAELHYEQSLLQTLMDNSPDLIFFKDTQSRFLKCSKALVQRMGMKEMSELTGKSDFDFYGEKHARQLFEDEQKIMQTGEPIVGKIEKETLKNDQVFWALTNKAPLTDKHGKIIGIFGISKDITAMKEAEAKLDHMHKELVDASHQAGMAEVATSVLHNVGNVLNSVNVSSSLIEERMHKSKVANLSKVAALLRANQNNLGDFFTNDPKGKQLTDYLTSLAEHLVHEQEEVLSEIKTLGNSITHIKEIVAMQQNYARTSGMVETLPVVELVDDALQLNSEAMVRHNIKIVREFADVPPIPTEKHKVLQILVNLIRNAKYACDDSGGNDKQITLRVANEDGRIKISVIDNGVGIPPENLTRIFNHGFTTRKEGHGFGLHNGSLAAKELGGSLTAFSDGLGRGATFTLELPVNGKKQ
jgi:PAS domain S-box-containing protein